MWQSTPKLSCLKQPFYYVYRFYGSGIWVIVGMACLCSVTSRASVGKIWWLVMTWQLGAGIPWSHNSDGWWLMLRPQLRLPTKPWGSSQNGGFKLLGLLLWQFRFTRQKHHFITQPPKSNCIISSTFYWLPIQIYEQRNWAPLLMGWRQDSHNTCGMRDIVRPYLKSSICHVLLNSSMSLE